MAVHHYSMYPKYIYSMALVVHTSKLFSVPHFTHHLKQHTR